MRTLNGGKRIIDKANDLLFQFLRFARGLRPKLVMLENVPALARNWRVRAFAQELRALGYVCDWRIVDAADYGVPQRRRRMIFIASRIGPPRFSRPVPTKRTVAHAIKCLPKPGRSGDILHDLPDRRAPHVIELIRHIPRNGGSRRDAPARFLLPCHRRLDGFYDVYGRMAWNECAPTITGGCHNPSKGRFLHPSQNRAITLREAALLQSFPRRYYFALDRGKEHAALMIGNALPPALIRRAALRLIKMLQDKYSSSSNLGRPYG
jgi:DNA (cytosine-5)-methyltransferase 1